MQDSSHHLLRITSLIQQQHTTVDTFIQQQALDRPNDVSSWRPTKVKRKHEEIVKPGQLTKEERQGDAKAAHMPDGTQSRKVTGKLLLQLQIVS
jgi:hypothetical protein